MSNALSIINADITSARDNFMAVLSEPSVNFEREAGFALQILTASDYAMKIATTPVGRQSVINAITNLGAIGLSLNPAKKAAYLVPRDGKICLDVSYRGLIDLAIDTGSIVWAQAHIVYDNESFEILGYDKPPEHKRNPFAKDKGAIVGAYVVAKTSDGDYLTEAMSLDEMNEIRDRSSAWKAWLSSQKKCPWVTDPGEMYRKTVVKRASKYWPRSEKTNRLDQAVHYLNTDGGEGIVDVAPAKFASQEWIAKAQATATEADLMTIYQDGIALATEVKDREGYSAFKDACIAHRNKLRAQNTVEHEGNNK